MKISACQNRQRQHAEIERRAGDVPGGLAIALLDEIIGEDGNECRGQCAAGDDIEDGIRKSKSQRESVGVAQMQRLHQR